MRRLFVLFLVSLALLVRIIAPGIVDARPAFDPLVDAPICTHDGTQDVAGKNDVTGKNDSSHKQVRCDLSCCHVAPGFVRSDAPSIVLSRTFAPLPWQIPGSAFVRYHLPDAPRARGPPIVS